MFVTIAMARKAGACTEGLRWFEDNFLNGAEHTTIEETLREQDEGNYADWLVEAVDDGSLESAARELAGKGTVADIDEEEFGVLTTDEDEEENSTTNQNEEENTETMSTTVTAAPQPFIPVTVTSKAQLIQLAKDIETAPKSFTPTTITFNNENEFHDVVAALAAYGRKTSSVSGSSIAGDFALNAYSGNARRTVNALLPQLKQVIGQ